MYKALLGPVLLAQGRSMRRTALRLPEAAGPRSGVIVRDNSGSELRVLFVGDSTMAGVGVRDQTAALAAQVCQLLADFLRRSVRWQLVAKSGVNTGDAFKLISRQELLSADVLVTALGTNDVTSQRRPGQFIRDYATLVDEVLKRARAKVVVVSGLPPLHLAVAAPQPLRWYLGSYARLLDEALRGWIAPQKNIAYVSLQWASTASDLAEDGFHPGERQYTAWAGLVAGAIVKLLAAHSCDSAVEAC